MKVEIINFIKNKTISQIAMYNDINVELDIKSNFLLSSDIDVQ